MDGNLEQDVRAAADNNQLSCIAAWGIAEKLRVNRRLVGDTCDRLGMRITDCQLGCFQTRKAAHDDLADFQLKDEVAGEVRAALADGTLSCAAAIKAALRLGATPKEIGDAATRMGVRIGKCQLGCF